MVVVSPLFSKRVLIVDDNAMDRIYLKGCLKALGFREIQEAEDGSIAQYKIDNSFKVNEPFDLLFIDLKMPRQNGMTLLERLKTHTKTHSLYIIMVTGSADLGDVHEARLKGVNDFIVKPVDPEVLKVKIETFMAQS